MQNKATPGANLGNDTLWRWLGRAMFLSWMAWISAWMLHGARFTAADGEILANTMTQGFREIGTKVNGIGGRLVALETIHPGDQPHPPPWTSRAIAGNAAAIVVLEEGQEMMRIDMSGMSSDLRYIVEGVDRLERANIEANRTD